MLIIFAFSKFLCYNYVMERPESITILDQMLIRGRYEDSTTDTARLAHDLSTVRDLGRVVTDFDNGLTPVRDVGRMITAQRDAILDAYETGTISDMATTHPEILSSPVSNLHNRIISGVRDQPLGHNFFVNATGFITANLPWAHQLNALFKARTGSSIYDIAMSDDIQGKDRLLAAMTENPDPELETVLAVYLAGRSLEGERHLESKYGNIMRLAKVRALSTTRSVAETTGLRISALERAAQQLQRTTFGSFDHLNGLVTSGDTGTAGDYQSGTLRVEVQYDGSVQSAQVRQETDALLIVAHELNHSASAQEFSRCGLRVNRQGLDANEGMTEYLAQISTGEPGIQRLSDGSSFVRPSVPYRAPVIAILALHEQFKAGRNTYFATLFNTYHGDVRSKAQLEEALDVFYEHDAAISGQLH